jgi:hypothetical protein
MTIPPSASVGTAQKQHSVPVIVDDPKRTGGFDMTRCVYFHIDCEDTLDEWAMDLGAGPIPFRMIGLSGVIVRPLAQSEIFDNPGQVENLFETAEAMGTGAESEAEADAMMHVELEEIWLPNELLNAEGRDVFRGAVFRIGYNLFRLAFAFALGRLTQNEFLERARDLRQVEFSEKETKAISVWASHEIEMAGKSALKSELYLPPKSEEKEK